MDNALIDYQQYSYSEYSALLDIADTQEVKALQSSPLEDWFYESHVLSDSIYDATPDESKLGYKYNYQFADVMNKQLLKGGLRLAALLNNALE